MNKIILTLILFISNISLTQNINEKDISTPKPWQDSRYKVKVINGDNVVLDSNTSLM